jgi:hypothetical protein
MTRTLSVAAILVSAATIWLMTPPSSQAAGPPVSALATERGAIVTPAMGRRERRCPEGKVYDRERRRCVVPRAKKEPGKEPRKDTKGEPK